MKSVGICVARLFRVETIVPRLSIRDYVLGVMRKVDIFLAERAVFAAVTGPHSGRNALIVGSINGHSTGRFARPSF